MFCWHKFCTPGKLWSLQVALRGFACRFGVGFRAYRIWDLRLNPKGFTLDLGRGASLKSGAMGLVNKVGPPDNFEAQSSMLKHVNPEMPHSRHHGKVSDTTV